MGKPNGLSRRLGKEKSGMDTYFCDEGQVMDLENDNIEEKENIENVELKVIDMVTWEKENRH